MLQRSSPRQLGMPGTRKTTSLMGENPSSSTNNNNNVHPCQRVERRQTQVNKRSGIVSTRHPLRASNGPTHTDVTSWCCPIRNGLRSGMPRGNGARRAPVRLAVPRHIRIPLLVRPCRLLLVSPSRVTVLLLFVDMFDLWSVGLVTRPYNSANSLRKPFKTPFKTPLKASSESHHSVGTTNKPEPERGHSNYSPRVENRHAPKEESEDDVEIVEVQIKHEDENMVDPSMHTRIQVSGILTMISPPVDMDLDLDIPEVEMEVEAIFSRKVPVRDRLIVQSFFCHPCSAVYT